MPKGTEILFSYVEGTFDYAVRREALRKTWGFDCDCPQCQDEAKENHSLRERMMETQWPKILQNLQLKGPTPRKAASAQEMQKATDHNESKFQLVRAFYGQIASTYRDHRQTAKMALGHILFDILDSLGEPGVNLPIAGNAIEVRIVLELPHQLTDE